MAYQMVSSFLLLVGVFLAVRYGVEPARRFFDERERTYDQALRKRLLLDVEPRAAVWLWLGGTAAAALLGLLVTQSLIVAALLGLVAFFGPTMVIGHLETKRREKLESQLVDGLSTLASGARAGLNLVQSMNLLVDNHRGPIQQEFAQLQREYQMGLDLNQAMRNASNRIASPLYRLTFTAIEMHRVRGGDTAESLDRIAESVREIQRLEGKLDALTAQGRSQAIMMATMPLVFLAILYVIDRGGVILLFTDPVGRIILLGVLIVIALAFVWIRKILTVDI